MQIRIQTAPTRMVKKHERQSFISFPKRSERKYQGTDVPALYDDDGNPAHPCVYRRFDHQRALHGAYHAGVGGFVKSTAGLLVYEKAQGGYRRQDHFHICHIRCHADRILFWRRARRRRCALVYLQCDLYRASA